MTETCDVAIVGAGPVGLALALGLARRGVDVVVLERDDGTAQHSRAPAIWPPTQRILSGLGVLDRFVACGLVVERLTLVDADNGQRELLSLPVAELADETDHPCLLVVPQSRTERLLCEAATAAGAQIRFGAEAVTVWQDDTGVEIGYAGREDGAIRARFAVGCDGGSSRVREAIGGSFDGITYDTRAALADVRVPGCDDLPFPRLTTRPSFAVAIRIEPELWRLILPHRAGDGRALDQRVQDAARALLPAAVSETVWKSEFELHRRISSRLSHGRIALAGDAAHLNSPVGGQGMNAGIADADALTAALAAALHVDSAAPLHDYTQRRRREIERGVNPFTDRLTRVLLFRDGALIRPTLAIARHLLRIRSVRRRFLRRATMLDTD